MTLELPTFGDAFADVVAGLPAWAWVAAAAVGVLVVWNLARAIRRGIRRAVGAGFLAIAVFGAMPGIPAIIAATQTNESRVAAVTGYIEQRYGVPIDEEAAAELLSGDVPSDLSGILYVVEPAGDLLELANEG
ncbi:hypothetical protein [Agromyces humi]|uniref:hypothetical protein n=1 Tax=Agromyces humi TaxID=1766800 RepID=UPI001358F6D5|nr:hypothetical protein [Agromyces humi]